ncbi:MAG: sulfurtransferase [Brevibacterium yomogidense]
MTDTRSSVLITVDELAGMLRADATPAPVLLDVRWTLTQPDGREDFASGHIPSARYVALDTELSDHSSADPTRGRHPLPSADQFEATVRSWGVRADTPVVVYDDVAGQGAARAWWMLRWAGHSDVRVLDGGWSAWRAADLPEETGLPQEADPAAASDPAGTSGAGGLFVIRPGSMPSLTADKAEALAGSGSGVLLDARAPERFEGRTEPLDPQAGHIPGALNAPAGGNTADGRFRSPAELAEYYRAVGGPSVAGTPDVTNPDGPAPPTIGAYCGSGVSASHTVLALASIGVEAALFPGSWSAWSNDTARPVATGTADDETVHPPQK